MTGGRLLRRGERVMNVQVFVELLIIVLRMLAAGAAG
jgi:hypothetical protein